ncbi:signal peptidase I [Sinomonas halotolerans]|uniref:Signal peptidase I n=1 Tax=Sinomonas halotolerans TaxID=1644133 RepID=A0ABU9WW18_9MICC
MPHTVLRAAGSALAWALMGLVFAVTVAVGIAPRVMGAVPLTILTGSMNPVLAPGDVAVVAPDPAGYRRGDIITMQPAYDDPRLVTHRVVSVVLGPDRLPSRYVTQGDANASPDEPVDADQVHGRMVYAIPLVGWALQAASLAQLDLAVRTAGILIAAWALTPTRLQDRLRAAAGRPLPRRRRTAPAA